MSFNRLDTELLSVRRRGCSSDSLMSQAALKNWLQSVDFVPQGMPASAVLISKSLRYHADFSRRLKNVQTGHRHSNPALEQNNTPDAMDCSTDIDRLMAARYLEAQTYCRGQAPSIVSDNIVFADWGESLACLLCDLVKGDVMQQWWWHSYLKKYPLFSSISQTITNILAQNLEYLTGIVVKLLQWRLLNEVFSRLANTDATDLTLALQNHYCLGRLHNPFLDTLKGFINAEAFNPNHDRNHCSVSGEKETVEWKNVSQTHGRMEPNKLDSEKMNIMAAYEQDKAFFQALHDFDLQTGFSRQTSAKQSVLLFWKLHTSLPEEQIKKLDIETVHFVGLVYVLAENYSRASDNTFSKLFQLLSDRFFVDHYNEAKRLLQLSFYCYMQAIRVNGIESDSRNLDVITVRSHENRYFSNKHDNVDVQGKIKPFPVNDVGNQSVDNNADLFEQAIGPPVKLFDREEVYETHYGGILYLINFYLFKDIPRSLADQKIVSTLSSPWSLLELFSRFLLSQIDMPDEKKERLWLDDIWRLFGALDNREPGVEATADSAFDRTVFPEWQGGLQDILGSDNLQDIFDLLHCLGRVHCSRTHIDFFTSLDSINIMARQTGLDRDPGWCPHFGKVVKLYYE